MATRYKVLGQSAAPATTNTNVYTVGALKEAIISTAVIANRTGTPTSYRLAVRPGGATLANEHYLAYDVTIGSNDSMTLTLGITLGSGDVITVYSSAANLTYSIFGSEIDL